MDKDIYNLRQLITNLEEAQEEPLPEAQKMGVLRGMMVDEQRLNLTQAFNWACLNKQQFEKRNYVLDFNKVIAQPRIAYMFIR